MPLSEKAAHAKDIRKGLDGCESLQHRHLAAIAAIISGLRYDSESAMRWTVAHAFAAEIGRRNSRFDGERFLAACKVTEKDKTP